MSWQSVKSVLEHSRSKRAARAVLLVIAWHADEHGAEAYPSLETLADESGVSRRTVMSAIDELERAGEIAVSKGRGRGQTHRFAVLLPLEKVQPPHVNEAAEKVQPLHIEAAIAPFTPEPEPEKVQPAHEKGQWLQEKVQPLHPINPDNPDRSTPNGVEDTGGRGDDQFSSLSPAAREVVDDWRRKQGRKKPPKINPALADRIETAVADLGVERLRESNTWAAENQIPEIIKAIRAAYSKRQRDEGEPVAVNGHRNGSARFTYGPSKGFGVTPEVAATIERKEAETRAKLARLAGEDRP